MTETASPRRKVREIEAVVAEVRDETHDTASLFLDIGAQPHDYKPGQFITVNPHQFAFLEQTIAYLEQIKGGKEKPRAYSMGSAPHESNILITIKEERFWPGESKYPPVLSPSLTRTCPPGTPVVIRGFTGAYTLPQDARERTDNILHVCAGSGIVPNFALIKHSLHGDDGLVCAAVCERRHGVEHLAVRLEVGLQAGGLDVGGVDDRWADWGIVVIRREGIWVASIEGAPISRHALDLDVAGVE